MVCRRRPPLVVSKYQLFLKIRNGGTPLLVVKIDKEMGHPVLLDIPTMIKVGKVVWDWRVSLSREDGRHRRLLSLELITPSRWIYLNQFVFFSMSLSLFSFMTFSLSLHLWSLFLSKRYLKWYICFHTDFHMKSYIFVCWCTCH